MRSVLADSGLLIGLYDSDASVYLLAVQSGVREVASVDQRDFAVYRLHAKQRFTNVLI